MLLHYSILVYVSEYLCVCLRVLSVYLFYLCITSVCTSEGSTKRHSDPIKTFANYQLATTTQYVFLKGAVYKGWSVAEAPGGLVATILLDRA